MGMQLILHIYYSLHDGTKCPISAIMG